MSHNAAVNSYVRGGITYFLQPGQQVPPVAQHYFPQIQPVPYHAFHPAMTPWGQPMYWPPMHPQTYLPHITGEPVLAATAQQPLHAEYWDEQSGYYCRFNGLAQSVDLAKPDAINGRGRIDYFQYPQQQKPVFSYEGPVVNGQPEQGSYQVGHHVIRGAYYSDGIGDIVWPSQPQTQVAVIASNPLPETLVAEIEIKAPEQDPMTTSDEIATPPLRSLTPISPSLVILPVVENTDFVLALETSSPTILEPQIVACLEPRTIAWTWNNIQGTYTGFCNEESQPQGEGVWKPVVRQKGYRITELTANWQQGVFKTAIHLQDSRSCNLSGVQFNSAGEMISVQSRIEPGNDYIYSGPVNAQGKPDTQNAQIYGKLTSDTRCLIGRFANGEMTQAHYLFDRTARTVYRGPINGQQQPHGSVGTLYQYSGPFCEELPLDNLPKIVSGTFERGVCTRGDLDLTKLTINGEQAQFKGRLKRIDSKYLPNPQKNEAVVWSNGRRFVGAWNGQGQPVSAQSLTWNDHHYIGAVNIQALPEGEGQCVYPDGRRLKGTFEKGMPIQATELVFADGSTYQGSVNAEGQPEGQGQLTRQIQWGGAIQTLIYQGHFSAGQYQLDKSNAQLTIKGLGIFTGVVEDASLMPLQGTIKFESVELSSANIQFDQDAIRVTDLVIKRPDFEIRYSGVIGRDGYPQAESGNIQIHWAQSSDNQPNDYTLSGFLSGDAILAKKRDYNILYADGSTYTGSVQQFRAIAKPVTVAAPTQVPIKAKDRVSTKPSTASTEPVLLASASTTEATAISASKPMEAEMPLGLHRLAHGVIYLRWLTDAQAQQRANDLYVPLITRSRDIAHSINPSDCNIAELSAQARSVFDATKRLICTSMTIKPAVEGDSLQGEAYVRGFMGALSGNTPVHLLGQLHKKGENYIFDPCPARLPECVMQLRQKMSPDRANIPLLPIPDTAGYSEQRLSSIRIKLGAKKGQTSVNVCHAEICYRERDEKESSYDFRYIGDASSLNKRWVPDGSGILITHAGHYFIGEFNVALIHDGKLKPVLQKGYIVWNGGALIKVDTPIYYHSLKEPNILGMNIYPRLTISRPKHDFQQASERFLSVWCQTKIRAAEHHKGIAKATYNEATDWIECFEGNVELNDWWFKTEVNESSNTALLAELAQQQITDLVFSEPLVNDFSSVIPQPSDVAVKDLLDHGFQLSSDAQINILKADGPDPKTRTISILNMPGYIQYEGCFFHGVGMGQAGRMTDVGENGFGSKKIYQGDVNWVTGKVDSRPELPPVMFFVA